MVYKIFGGGVFLLIGLEAVGAYSAPSIVLGIFAIIAGVALLAGL